MLFRTDDIVVCFSFSTNYRLKRSLYVKFEDGMSNSVDPDLYCLQNPIFIACGSES